MVHALRRYFYIDCPPKTDSLPVLEHLKKRMRTLAVKPYPQRAHAEALLVFKCMDLPSFLEYAFSFLGQGRLVVL
jgi:hypothetical protein